MIATGVIGARTVGQAAGGACRAPAAGRDMEQLRRSYQPRAARLQWLASQQPIEAVVTRLLAPPFPAEPDRPAMLLRRRRGLTRLLGWLSAQPGESWQQRWLASGADGAGNAGWWQRVAAAGRRSSAACGVSSSSNFRVGAVILVVADVIRPSLDWVLTPRVPQTLVSLMAQARDPAGFAELAARCDASPAGRTMKAAALRRAATILAVKGGLLHEITVGDCLELSAAVDVRSVRQNAGMGFYQLLHEMDVFGPDAPATMRAFATTGQRSPAQLIDRWASSAGPCGTCSSPTCRNVRRHSTA